MSFTNFLKTSLYFVYAVWYSFYEPSPFIQMDQLSSATYAKNGWNAAQEVEKFSYTSNRVLVPRYNTYEKNELKVCGYYTDWSQYDARLQNGAGVPNDQNGRGNDLMAIDAAAYDKIIVGFAAIVGDRGPKQSTVDSAARQFGRAQNQVTFLDPWGDVLSYVNVGFTRWKSDDAKAMFDESQAQGVLGGLLKLKRKNPNLRLSFSVGGWTMSEAFHRVAADAAASEAFADSVADVFKRFPSFGELDLDWEYPNAKGRDGQPFGPEDAPNFASLVRAVKRKLAAAGRADVAVSVAVAGTAEKLQAANVRQLLEAGVYAFNVMTYDYFGTPWATELAHHTNLFSNGANQNWSVDKAVEYLLQAGIPSRQIFIGYAVYSRNARNAKLTSVSPLRGTYAAGPSTTVGTFESGTSEFHDVLSNYLELNATAVAGKNNFVLYTDDVANADFLYNPETALFMSVDTPRTAKAKAEYARKRKLGGVFTWTIESDRGALVNAAREGFGQKIIRQNVDMRPLYAKGKTSL